VTENPLLNLLNSTLSDCDFGVMEHGFFHTAEIIDSSFKTAYVAILERMN